MQMFKITFHIFDDPLVIYHIGVAAENPSKAAYEFIKCPAFERCRIIDVETEEEYGCSQRTKSGVFASTINTGTHICRSQTLWTCVTAIFARLSKNFRRIRK